MKELILPIKWKHTTEAKFTTAWLKELRVKWYYCDKISDWSIWAKKVDCYIRTKIDTYCCEIKVIEVNTFNLSRLRPNQWASLRKWYELWWTAILCVYSKKHNKYKIFNFEKIKDLSSNDNVSLIFK